MEIWKDIEGYKGLYQISTHGRVKSFRRSTKYKCQEEYILKPYLANNGYYQVTLYSNNGKKKFSIHRLVAQAFIPNPDLLPQINHKDEDRLNNNVNNLEWCTAIYNNRYGTAFVRSVESKSHPIRQLTLEKKPIAIYRSAKIAGELLGFNAHNIQACCNQGIVGYGYYWEYISKDFKL